MGAETTLVGLVEALGGIVYGVRQQTFYERSRIAMRHCGKFKVRSIVIQGNNLWNGYNSQQNKEFQKSFDGYKTHTIKEIIKRRSGL